MTTPRAVAAQLWCLPQHAHKEMDVEFAESIAHALADAERRAYQTLTGRLEMMERYMKSARYVEALELIVNTHAAIRSQAQVGKEG